MPTWGYATIPWVALPGILLWRSRGAGRLDAYAPRAQGHGADPLGRAVLAALFAAAAWRGDRAEWKGRTYRSRPAPPASGTTHPPAAQVGV